MIYVLTSRTVLRVYWRRLIVPHKSSSVLCEIQAVTLTLERILAENPSIALIYLMRIFEIVPPRWTNLLCASLRGGALVLLCTLFLVKISYAMLLNRCIYILGPWQPTLNSDYSQSRLDSFLIRPCAWCISRLVRKHSRLRFLHSTNGTYASSVVARAMHILARTNSQVPLRSALSWER